VLRFLVVFLLIALPAHAQVPPDFIGFWNIAADENAQCKKSDWETNRRDGMMMISPSSVQGSVHSCDIRQVRKFSPQSVEVDVECRGEGMTWKAKEYWHTQLIGGEKQLVTVTLSKSKIRKGNRRILFPAGPQSRVTIHLVCN
jgi:hypothetical protein